MALWKSYNVCILGSRKPSMEARKTTKKLHGEEENILTTQNLSDGGGIGQIRWLWRTMGYDDGGRLYGAARRARRPASLGCGGCGLDLFRKAVGCMSINGIHFNGRCLWTWPSAHSVCTQDCFAPLQDVWPADWFLTVLTDFEYSALSRVPVFIGVDALSCYCQISSLTIISFAFYGRPA